MDSIDEMLLKEYAAKRAKAERLAMNNLVRARKVPAFVKLEGIEKELAFELGKLKAVSPRDSKVKKIAALLESVRAEKRKILALLHLTEADLKPKYSCNKCFDTGYVAGKMCDCMRTRKDAELSKLYGLLGGESGMNFSTFNVDLISDPAQKLQMQKLKDFLEKWAKKYPNVHKKTITICGGTGLGKTFIAKCFAGELAKRGINVCFISAFKLNQMFLESHTAPSAQKLKKLSPALNSEVLIVDDLGTEPTLNNVTNNYLTLVMSERERQNKPVIVTTNLMPENVMDRYGERVYSRLTSKQQGKIVHLTGKDLRKESAPAKEMINE